MYLHAVVDDELVTRGVKFGLGYRVVDKVRIEVRIDPSQIQHTRHMPSQI